MYAVALLIGGTAALGAGLFLRHQYRKDTAAARRALLSLGPKVVTTRLGPIQYQEDGDGLPVLVVHGIWGGFDQGRLNAGHAFASGFRRIFVSRFGYLGSPLPPGATVEAQADLYAALLDELRLDRVAVLAHSAGSTSALQFALRYPDRVSGIVLVSPNAPGEVDLKPPPRPITEALFRSAFLFWLLVRYFPQALYGIMGVPKGYSLARTARAFVDAMARTILPASDRADGAIFDALTSNPAIARMPLERIECAVLVVAAEDDPSALFRNSAALAAALPGGKLLSVESGGHMLLNQEHLVEPKTAEFLRSNFEANVATTQARLSA